MRLDRLVATLEPHGFSRNPSLGGHGFLVEGASRTHSLSLDRDSCLTIVSMGSPGVRDIDAQIYSPDGAVLAEDDEPDPHPIVQLCSRGPETRRVYYVIKMFAGAGAYRFVGLRSTRGALAGAIEALRGDTAARPRRSGLDSRLDELGASLAEHGFSSRGEPVTSTLASHESIRIAIPTEKSVCYTVAALGGSGVGNLDLVLVDEELQEIAADVGPSLDATAQFCSEIEETISAEVRMIGGSGEIRFAIFGGASENVGGPGRLWLGERHDRPSEMPIQQALSAVQETLRRAGYSVRAADPPARIRQREVQSHTVQAAAGRCTAVVAVGGRGLGRLRVSAFDAAGDPVADPAVGIGTAGVRICPARAVAARIDVEARRGGGDVALVSAEIAPPAAIRSARPLLASRLQTLLDQAAAGGYALAGDVATTHMPSGALRQIPAASRARCLRAVAATDGMGPELRLYLLDPAGHRLAADHSTGGAAWIELCEAPGVVANLEVRLEHAGPGDVEVRLARLERQ